jgi:hypothetical protein
MTSARIVAPGQAMAMIPTITARAPRTIKAVDTDLSMTDFLRLTWLRTAGAQPLRAAGAVLPTSALSAWD